MKKEKEIIYYLGHIEGNTNSIINKTIKSITIYFVKENLQICQFPFLSISCIINMYD